MKKLLVLFSIIVAAYSCKSDKKIPDVSKVNVDVKLERFEKDFFNADTTQMVVAFDGMNKKYQAFFIDYVQNILALSPPQDSMMKDAKFFIASYKPVYDSSLTIFKNFDAITNEIKKGMQFVKYYFPKYPLPKKVITFIGPMNSFQNLITPEGLYVGLQLYMGKDFSWYNTDRFQVEYPKFVSRKFDQQYIPVNCMKNIIEDLYPTNPSGQTLVEQMVEAGKRLYLLDAFLPNTADTLKTGYTAEQLKGCYENEINIWGLFVNNDLLFTSDPALMKDYMNDAPNTAALGEKSPGLIGHFTGWQIVKKWMEKNDKKTLPDLMKTPPKQIFEESKYKPK